MDFDPFSPTDLRALWQQMEIASGQVEGYRVSWYEKTADCVKVLEWAALAETARRLVGEGEEPGESG